MSSLADGAVRDLRAGDAWTVGQRLRNALWLALARGAVALLGPFPRSWLRTCGRLLGWVAYAVVPSARRVAHENTSRVLPSWPLAERRRLVRRAYCVLGAHLGETLAFLGRPARFVPLPFASGALEVLDQARAEGRGVVFASAHLGPWERVAGSLTAAGLPLTTVAREAYDPRLTGLYDRLRDPLRVGVIYRGSPGAASRIVRTLRHGRILGLPMDLSSRVASVEAAFLGHPARTAVGPARIALRTRASVVVGTVAPVPRNGHEPSLAITCTRIPTEDLQPDRAGEIALTARINAELSSRILALPEAWVWMHPRW